MKQTAVEWLESQILEGSINIENGEMYIKLPKDALKKTKEMEKDNIINFALQCMFGRTDIGSNLKNDFIKKYKETFKSE